MSKDERFFIRMIVVGVIIIAWSILSLMGKLP